MSVEIENEKSEVLRRSIPFGRVGELATTAASTIWPTDVSSYYAGRGVAADKAQRIRAAAARLIDLYDSVVVKPNWRSGRNVRTALAKLAEIRANPATAPWQHRGAVAPFEADNDLTSSASGILAGANAE